MSKKLISHTPGTIVSHDIVSAVTGYSDTGKTLNTYFYSAEVE